MLTVEPKVKGCLGPANGDEELTLNLTLSQGRDMQFGWVHCLPRACLLLKRQKPSVAHLPLCLSFFLSFSLPLSLFLSVSSLPICM